VKVLYLEDDLRDIELLRMTCAHEQPDCELTPVMDRATFVAGLKSGRYAGILSDSGVHDLFGADAVQLARSMAPAVPYVFLCGMMSDAKRADLEAAKPDGVFSKDRSEDVGLAIGLIRRLSAASGA
jgi:CheY-like chemotaxis protein